MFDADVEHDAQDVGKSLELLLEIGADFRRTLFVPHWLPTSTNLRVERAIRQIEKVLYRMIAEKRASGRDAGDLLSMLLAAQDEDGSRMTDKQLRDEAITLFLAGHETTANALAWTWWLLAQNPAAETKLYAELRTVLAGRAPSFDDLPKLVYTNHIITESMTSKLQVTRCRRARASRLRNGRCTATRGGTTRRKNFVPNGGRATC
jgi:cytochrome P450